MSAALPEGPREASIIYRPFVPTPEYLQTERELEQLRTVAPAVADAEARERQAVAELTTAGRDLEPQLATVGQRVEETKRQADVEIQQVHDNRCCSECDRTKAEIEVAGSESFADHVTRVRGTVTGCDPEVLPRVREKWADKLKDLDDEAAAVHGRIAQAKAGAQRKLDEAKAAAEAARTQRDADIQAAQERLKRLRRGGT